MTLNQVYNKLLRPIAEDHSQLNDFGYGNLDQISKSRDIKYPIMWPVFRGVTYTGKAYRYNFSLVFADLVKDDLSNVLEVQSDLIQVAADVATKIAHNESHDVTVVNNFVFNPFTERFVDMTAGVAMDITIVTDQVLSDCDFPSREEMEAARLMTEDNNPIVTEDGVNIEP